MSYMFRCSRTHDIPEDSCTLLFPGMYANFELEQSMRDEYDTGSLAIPSLYFKYFCHVEQQLTLFFLPSCGNSVLYCVLSGLLVA